MSTSEDRPDPTFGPLVHNFFAEKCGQAVVTEAEAKILDADLWSAVVDLGLPLIGVPEEAGGSGGSLQDLLVALRAAGGHAVPLPLVETNVAAWALARAGLDIPSGPLTIVPGDDRDSVVLQNQCLTGLAYDVPWARAATHVVTVVADGAGDMRLVMAEMAATDVSPGRDLANQPKDRVSFEKANVTSARWPGRPDELFLRGALLRSALMAGALEAVSALTRQYVRDRVQFGRPVGSNQAVQEHIVRLEQAATMSLLCVERAANAWRQDAPVFEVLSTKLVLNENATLAVRAAHQAHGAIGMTQEYRLQLLTRRLNSWSHEFGGRQALACRLGAAVSEGPGIARIITADAGRVWE